VNTGADAELELGVFITQNSMGQNNAFFKDNLERLPRRAGDRTPPLVIQSSQVDDPHIFPQAPCAGVHILRGAEYSV